MAASLSYHSYTFDWARVEAEPRSAELRYLQSVVMELYQFREESPGLDPYDDNSMYGFYFEAEEDTIVGVSFKRLKSSGPSIFLLGAYLDLDTGWWRISDQKTEDSFVLVNLYALLEERFNVPVVPRAFAYYVEQFKLGNTSLAEAIFHTLTYRDDFTASHGSKLRRLLAGTRSSETVDSVDLDSVNLYTINKLEDLISDFVTNIMTGSVVAPMEELEIQPPYGLASVIQKTAKFLHPRNEETLPSDEAAPLLFPMLHVMDAVTSNVPKYNFTYDTEGEHRDLPNHSYRFAAHLAASTPGLGGMLNMKVLSFTEILARNFFDLVEDTDQEDEVAVAISDLQSTGSARLLDAVEERIGISTLYKHPGTLEVVKKGLRGDRMQTLYSSLLPESPINRGYSPYRSDARDEKDTAIPLVFWNRFTRSLGRVFKAMKSVYS